MMPEEFDAHFEAKRKEAERESVATESGVGLVWACDVVPEPISWLWEGWIAAGKLHILGGRAGTGKTTLAMSLAATVSRGGSFPDGTICKRSPNALIRRERMNNRMRGKTSRPDQSSGDSLTGLMHSLLQYLRKTRRDPTASSRAASMSSP